MNITVFPSKLAGTVKAIPSKSQAHRALICAALAGAPLSIVQYDSAHPPSKDIEATVQCLEALFGKAKQAAPVLQIAESASTYRFLKPIVEELGLNASFELGERLRQRCVNDSGTTSQYISGRLMALPLLEVPESQLRLQGENQVSMPYIELTVDVMRRFGIQLDFDNYTFRVPGGQKYRAPEVVNIEGDWSNAAFWLCANALGADITVTGLNPASKQGDKAVVDILQRANAGETDATDVVEVDARDCPDLVPILAFTAFGLGKPLTVHNPERLKLKESDRIAAVNEVLSNLKSGRVSSHGDHRIVMSAAIAAALLCERPVTIEGADAVQKSYPHFFEDFAALGAIISKE